MTPYSMWTKEALIKELQQKQEYIAEKECQIFILVKKIKDSRKILDNCCKECEHDSFSDECENDCKILDVKLLLRESSSTKGCGELAVTGGTTPIRENGQLSSLTKVASLDIEKSRKADKNE